MSPLRRALIPLVASLAGCTNAEIPDGVPWVTAPTYEDHEPYFPIDGGKHEGIDCNKCHGDFDTFTEFTCISCHVHSAEETNPPHNGLLGYTYTSTSCFSCHPRGEVDGAGPGHELIFPVADGTAHGQTPCAGCHIDGGDREVVTCVDCHAHEVADSAAEHAPVGGYTYETAECLKCHYDSGVPRVAEHRPFRIDAAAEHSPARAACLGCHVAEQPGRPFPSADFSRSSCAACHLEPEMTEEHEGVIGYRYADRACLTCHADGEAASRASHDATFPISAGSKHEQTDCASCHVDPADAEVVTCVDCHAHERTPSANEHTAVGGYLYETSECLKCHYDSGVPRVADHAPFRIDAASSHDPASAECLRCHTAVQAARPFPSADFTSYDCTGCHLREDLEPTHGTMADYRFDSPTCLTCHVDGETISRVEHDRIFPVSAGTKHETTDCGSCHADPNDAEVVTCVGCHPHESGPSSTAHRGVGGYAFQSDLCLRCHPSSGVDRLAQHRPFRIDSGAKHRPEKAECLECHSSLDSTYQFPAADFEIFDCTTSRCHSNRNSLDNKEDHRRAASYDYDNSLSCVASGCHPDGRE